MWHADILILSDKLFSVFEVGLVSSIFVLNLQISMKVGKGTSFPILA